LLQGAGRESHIPTRKGKNAMPNEGLKCGEGKGWCGIERGGEKTLGFGWQPKPQQHNTDTTRKDNKGFWGKKGKTETWLSEQPPWKCKS